uniref:Usp domain-containing protein n=1 Tax=Macrostomum lignano TaxID=282301 RepID=A0A1I8JPD6_9PLAT
MKVVLLAVDSSPHCKRAFDMYLKQVRQPRTSCCLSTPWSPPSQPVALSFSFVNVSGEPGEAIVQAAEEHEADLVVMGSRGLGTLRRTFLGSVSDYVLHHAYRPVLICPPSKREATE